MSTEDPQTTLHQTREADYKRFKNYAAYTFLIGAPILLALPPRKLDPLSVLVICSFGFSANHLATEHTGKSLIDRLDARISRVQNVFSDLPSERAQEIQERLRAARDAQLAQAQQEQLQARIAALEGKLEGGKEDGSLSAEIEKLKARQMQEKGVVQRVWMGGESEGWKERRLREERKALSEGKGYGDLIQEHIWDVWTWGGKEGKGEVKEVVEEEKKE
ncbi:uncharacterized protein N7515_009494 [Penicillium bovifimosum]|uniref:Uncharacterized protein n=1 Tax=Penicillium bovifimosum TaxID=126998 RepID=A0A9W9GJE4_9EURO|nr:uncharacterized protein N7515_009494 [Penicillium bovifimosum]KAJ5121533.1 hypothetical protein N7515_009494 [Penicillium bovifimosum]